MNNEFILTTITFSILLGLTVIISSSAEALRCSQIGKELNYKTQWHFWTGCIVEKSDGSKILLKQIRDFERN